MFKGMSRMKVSIIIPVYNCEKYIAQTLNCIWCQTMAHRDMEIILCLDAPTDGTAAIVKEWARTHRGIHTHIIVNKSNRGVSYARNVAIGHARGEYIHFMDADDLINVDFYRALYDAASAAGADVAVASYQHQRRPNCGVIFDVATIVSEPQEKIDFTRVDQHGMMWRYLVRREFWRHNGFVFPEDMKICEDWVLANKMVFVANYIALVPAATYLYRSRENSLISVGNAQREDGADRRRANAEMKEFLTENSLQKCVKMRDIFDCRLFGSVRVFTVSCVDNKREWRLFGKILIMRTVHNYSAFRKPI